MIFCFFFFFFFQAEDGIRDGTVTGVQTCALPIWAVRANEGVRADEYAEGAEEAAHLADRLRAVVVEAVRVALANDRGDRKERLQPLRHSDRAAAGAAAAVWLRERLVQVDVDDLEAHVPGP